MSSSRVLAGGSAFRGAVLAILAVVIVVLAFLSAPVAQAAGSVGEAEPNSTTAKAQNVALATTVNASFRTTGDCDNNFYDCDVYRFTAAQAGKLTLDIRFSDRLGTSGSFDLWILDAAGESVYNHSVSVSEYDGSALRGLSMYVDAGTFYVSLKARVSGFGSGYIWSGQPYSLSAQVAPMRAETERNNTSARADTIALGEKVVGSTFSGDCDNGFYDCDYFRAQLSKSTPVSLDFRFPCTLGTAKIYTVTISDNAGKTLVTRQVTGSECKGDALRAVTVTAPAGNVYVLVQSRARTVTRGQQYSVALSGVLTTGTPTVSGTAKVGSTLTAKPGTWGPAPVSYTYQWTRNGTAISGATSSTYKLVAADAGTKVAVKVTGVKSGYRAAAKTSATVKVAALLSLTKTPVPTISGTAKIGATLTAKAGTWAPSGTSLAYQWLRDGKAISGATKSTYKPVAADAGKKITVKVTGTKTGYKSVAKTSAPTAAVKK